MKKSYTITMIVEVNCKRDLYRHACFVAAKDGLTPQEWAKDRKSDHRDVVENDLIMVFDPGESPPGTTIIETTITPHDEF
jgi:hypothetical protein